MARVQLELNMKIMEMELKPHPSTSSDVQEQHDAFVKECIANVDVEVANCTTLFEQAMEVVMTLHKYPTLQILSTKIHELQHYYDEVRVMACSITTVQHLAKFQEEK